MTSACQALRRLQPEEPEEKERGVGTQMVGNARPRMRNGDLVGREWSAPQPAHRIVRRVGQRKRYAKRFWLSIRA